MASRIRARISYQPEQVSRARPEIDAILLDEEIRESGRVLSSFLALRTPIPVSMLKIAAFGEPAGESWAIVRMFRAPCSMAASTGRAEISASQSPLPSQAAKIRLFLKEISVFLTRLPASRSVDLQGAE